MHDILVLGPPHRCLICICMPEVSADCAYVAIHCAELVLRPVVSLPTQPQQQPAAGGSADVLLPPASQQPPPQQQRPLTAQAVWQQIISGQQQQLQEGGVHHAGGGLLASSRQMHFQQQHHQQPSLMRSPVRSISDPVALQQALEDAQVGQV